MQLREVLQADRVYLHSQPDKLGTGNVTVKETGRQLSQEGHTGNETFAFAPDWLFGAWNDRGASGFWDPGLAGTPPKQVGAGSQGWGRALLQRGMIVEESWACFLGNSPHFLRSLCLRSGHSAPGPRPRQRGCRPQRCPHGIWLL